MAQRPYIVGNWKMHGTRAMLGEARAIDRAAERLIKAEVALTPPFTLIHAIRSEAQLIGVGAQTCHPEDGRQHTGEISASMAKDAGAGFVIVGHCERRRDGREGDADVKARAEAALTVGLGVIVCVGESAHERESGEAEQAIAASLHGSLPRTDRAVEKLTVAYEPVWAVGTGKTPSVEQIGGMHRIIREHLREAYGEPADAVRILYGGSVTAENAAAILAADEVGGALIGGASLTADSFLGIVAAAADREG